MYEKSRDESNADTDLSKQMLLDIGVILRINMCFYLLRKFLYKNRLQIPAALLPSAYRRPTIQFGKSVNH